ncbi:RNA polymerase II elongation factor ELL-like [Haliotis rufescens]|uniref:RNA polymerase II elongation factor ELL-like n=1 Tax=Haliotis rufescens TaxID=6454 RepID=UPI001EB07CD2|nr:RNA polymerase II elongation factor ELL-like [Haliotis rufescens]
MAALVEGQEYGLISNDSSIGNKTVIHVKLTDSALRAIEEFSKIKHGTNRRPTIQLDGNQGHFQVPLRGSGDDPRASRTFRFNLAQLQGDPNGSFECIQQPDSRYGHTLESLGVMQQKINVLATDDVYKSTRERMTLAEEESKKVCTKEIKPSGRYISKKVKKVITNGHNKHLPPTNKNNIAISKPQPPPHIPKSSTNFSNVSNPGQSRLSGTSHLPNGGTNHSPNRVTASQHSPHRSTGSNHSPVRGSGTTTVSSMSTKPSSHVPPSSGGGSKPNSAIMNMPYRERIIHLLAVRPFKKPEMLLRLKKDGIREKDKNSLGSILQQVAVLNKSNSYTLANHAWIDVRTDWPFYAEADRQLVKRNLQNLQAESRSASTSPAVSPSNQAPESPSNSQKRASEDVIEAPQPNKKQRISHHEKRKEPSPVNGLKSSNSHHHAPHDKRKSSSLSPDANRENKAQHIDDNGNTVSSNSSNCADYLKTYTMIKNQEQRQKYKGDFNSEYDEYRKLFGHLDTIAKKFGELEIKIRKTKEGSEAFETLKNRILEEYQTQKSDPKFIEQKKRYDYLHKKLAHIKKLIMHFDQCSLSLCS